MFFLGGGAGKKKVGGMQIWAIRRRSACTTCFTESRWWCSSPKGCRGPRPHTAAYHPLQTARRRRRKRSLAPGRPLSPPPAPLAQIKNMAAIARKAPWLEEHKPSKKADLERVVRQLPPMSPHRRGRSKVTPSSEVAALVGAVGEHGMRMSQEGAMASSAPLLSPFCAPAEDSYWGPVYLAASCKVFKKKTSFYI